MATDVELTVEDGIAWLTMRRPQTRNAVEAEFMEAAIAALDVVPDGAGALAAFLRNRRITADELLARGLADEVAPDGQVWAAAQRLATEVVGASPAALLATRRLMDAAPTHSFDEHLDAEEASIRPLLTTADVAEGVAAFLERRRPKFQGA